MFPVKHAVRARSHVACLDTPSAAPMRLRLTTRALDPV